jgi:hypothetical protein
LRGVYGYPEAAGECQLKSPTQTEALNKTYGRKRNLFEPAENPMDLLDELQRFRGIDNRSEFSDVRPSDESIRLPEQITTPAG